MFDKVEHWVWAREKNNEARRWLRSLRMKMGDENWSLDETKSMLIRSQSCLTLCESTNCNPPGSSVCGIFQTRILEWVPFPPQGIFLTQRLNLSLLNLLHWQADSLPLSHLRSPAQTDGKLWLGTEGSHTETFLRWSSLLWASQAYIQLPT